jgi:P-type Mg2+ transporter
MNLSRSEAPFWTLTQEALCVELSASPAGHSSPEEFRTVWFLESMATQILVIFVIRTNGRPWRDLPHPVLTASSLTALTVAMVLPFSPIGAWFGFEAPPPAIVCGVLALVVIYLACSELLKQAAIGQESIIRA